MNMIYNSPTYCVVEFGAINGHVGGYEIMDKPGRREIFINGELAASFRQHVQELIATEPSTEEIDDFLGSFDELMRQPVHLH